MPTVQVNGAGLYYTETGRRDGEVVVFSHGLLFDHTMFERANRMRLFRDDGQMLKGASGGKDLRRGGRRNCGRRILFANAEGCGQREEQSQQNRLHGLFPMRTGRLQTNGRRRRLGRRGY